MSWKLHAPVLKVLLATAATYAGLLSVHARTGGLPSFLSWTALLCILAGALYTHLFEYVYHLQLMHRVIRIGKFRFHDKRHLLHHRLFAGDNFQTRIPEKLVEVTTSWYTFPALFAIHYAIFRAIFGPTFAPVFFLGVSAQFLAYEISHWLIHLENNFVDQWLGRTPLLGAIRKQQIRHHRLHHARPDVNFNFTPPYAGDRIGRTRAI